jgi:hypothetical protein
MVMDKFTLSNSTIALSVVKMLGDLKTVMLIIHLFTVTIHTHTQFVMVLGLVTILI